jgi:DNA-binding NarL/FixJ family response regulator
MSTVAPPAGTGPLAAWVLGPPNLLQDISTHLLKTGGIDVLADGEEATASPELAVLIEPTSDDWRLARSKDVPIVLVTGDELTGTELLDAVYQGADAMLHSGSRPAALVDAAKTVVGGGGVLDAEQTRAVMVAVRVGLSQPAVRLTPREADIIKSIARGDAVKQTARALGISAKTVENLQSRLFRKLEVRNRAQAVARAHALALLAPA